MKKYTEQELQKIVTEACPRGDWEITIIKQTDKELLFEATHMYEPYEKYFNTKHVLAFIKAFGTENIDKYEDISQQGCDTCDYGSNYGFVLRVWE